MAACFGDCRNKNSDRKQDTLNEQNKLIEKKPTELVKEKSQYVIAFGVIGMMLYITGFPMFVIFFFGILAFFIWKFLAAPPAYGIRSIFEFYLQANDILRDDERRWYGFEIEEVIARGERILKHMKGAPPLVSFAVGALYHKIGDYRSAEEHLSFIAENQAADERSFVNPSNHLREYVKVLRKIEREPAESPLLSTAVRALERARKNRASTLLEQSRDNLRKQELNRVEAEQDAQTPPRLESINDDRATVSPVVAEIVAASETNAPAPETKAGNSPPEPRRSVTKSDTRKPDSFEPFGVRKPITEVLRDIYDQK